MGATVSVSFSRGRVAELQSGLMFPRRLCARWAGLVSRAGCEREAPSLAQFYPNALSLAQFHPDNNNRKSL